MEIIAEIVYANNSQLDGRRFAEDFYNRRKQEAQTRTDAVKVVKPASLADSKSQAGLANELR